MKKGDLVRIKRADRLFKFLISDNYGGMTGVIVNYVTLDAKIPVWSVLVDGVVIPVRETNMEKVGD